MHWPSIASALLEWSERPAIVLDRRGRIQLANRAFERLTQTPRHTLERQPFVQACHLAEDERTFGEVLRHAFRGLARAVDVTMTTPRGARILASLELALVGRALIATVTASRAVEPQRQSAAIHFELSTSPEDFGTILGFWDEGSYVAEYAGRKCYQVMQDRASICPDCPLLRHPDEATCSVLRDARRPSFNLVSLRGVRPGTHQVTIFRLTEDVLRTILRARVDTLAQKGGLSERERHVLDLLLLGRSHDEIGSVLEMSVRTVKFHQTRLLEKLGADSRNDLVRLVL